MPKDEFDFADPFELNGHVVSSSEDTTPAMAECFVEEFMRMGYGPKQVLALFRNPHYLGPALAWTRLGEARVKDLISEVYARWGRVTAFPGSTPEPEVSPGPETQLIPIQTPLPHPALTDPMGAPVPVLNQ